MDLKELLSGIENSKEIIKAINTKLSENSTTLLFDDGKDNIYIPKIRLDKEIAKRKTVEATKDSLEKDLNLTKKEVKDNETLVANLDKTQKERDKLKLELENTELDIAVTSVIESFERKPHNIEDIKEKLDYKTISKSDDGKVTGVKEQLENLVKSKEYLYKPVEGGTGNPGGPNNSYNNEDLKDGEFGKSLATNSSKPGVSSEENNVYGLK